MEDAPEHIDGALVIAVALLDPGVATGATRHFVGGRQVHDFAALAIARYETEAGVYLFYCDEEWHAVTDTYHESIEHAEAQVRFEFGPVTIRQVH